MTRISKINHEELFEQSSSGILLIDNSGMITACNISAAKMLSKTKDTLIGANFLTLNCQFILTDGSIFPSEQLLKTLLLSDASLDNTPLGLINDDSNRPIWLLVSTQILDRKEAVSSELLIQFHDITKLIDFEQKTKNSQIEKEKGKLISQFIQSASHEFRTPLSIIQLSLDLLAKKAQEPENLRYVQKSKLQIKRLVHLVDILLLIAELDSWDNIATTPTSITQLIESLIERSNNQLNLSPQRIQLVLDISDSEKYIEANKYYLLLALQEIIKNAVQFSSAEDPITITVSSLDKFVEIRVSDVGIGMSQDDINNAFKRFWRKDQAHSTPGFGLGLVLAQRVVEMHKGHISLQSNLQSDTTVKIRLPL